MSIGNCDTGALTLPPAVIVSITKLPESDDVTKKTITSTIPSVEVIAERGRLSSIAKSDSSGE